MNGCWKRNSFSTSLVAVAAAAAGRWISTIAYMSVLVMAVVVAVVVDIHDCLYVCIGDGGGPARSSSIRTRATVVEVTGWRSTGGFYLL